MTSSAPHLPSQAHVPCGIQWPPTGLPAVTERIPKAGSPARITSYGLENRDF